MGNNKQMIEKKLLLLKQLIKEMDEQQIEQLLKITYELLNK